jgi:hypothetical protein
MLITLLALQFSWSVVAVYCTHETGKAANHWGHHPDTNPSDNVASILKEKPTDAKKSSAHSHCASCAHGTCRLIALKASRILRSLKLLQCPPKSSSPRFTPLLQNALSGQSPLNSGGCIRSSL